MLWAWREEAFSIEEVHRASFIIQRRRSDMREGDASVCITPALPLCCITILGGSFFESLIRSLSVALWLWLISASDKSLYLSPSSFALSHSLEVPPLSEIFKGVLTGWAAACLYVTCDCSVCSITSVGYYEPLMLTWNPSPTHMYSCLLTQREAHVPYYTHTHTQLAAGLSDLVYFCRLL